MVTTRRALALVMFTATGMGVAFRAARAEGIPLPTGKTVLVISGAIGVTNVGKTAVFDMPTLESVGLSQFVTATPWDEGKVTYEGVLLDKLMKYVGAHGQRLLATALNDYTAELPVSDFAKYGTLLATKRNGKYMPISDKGPLFIIYPFDSNPDLQQQTFYGRSVWQVNKMAVE